MNAPHQLHELECGMSIALYGDPDNGYDVVVSDVTGVEQSVHTPDADGALFAFKSLRIVLESLISEVEVDEVVSAA